MDSTRRCSVDGCERPQRARGWCNGHYIRVRKYGDPGLAILRTPTAACAMRGCERKHYARGWCKTHYNYEVRHRSPEELGTRACGLDGCRAPHYSRGWCRLHWERANKHGDPEVVLVVKGEDPLAKIARLTEPEGDCLVWTGARNEDGYGYTSRDNRYMVASRFSWEAHHGPIPKGLVVRHKCDNRPCVRVDHLELGTPRDNTWDMVERTGGHRGERNPAAKITRLDAERIRELAAAGSTQAALAKRYGLAPSQVSRIVRGLSWPEKYPERP